MRLKSALFARGCYPLTAHNRRSVRGCRKRKNASLTWLQRVGVLGISGLLLTVPFWHLNHAEGGGREGDICLRLADIPPPPMPTPDQDFAVAYTNSILALLREEFNCG